MKKIIFWNLQHLSPRAIANADRAAIQKGRLARTFAAQVERRANHGPQRPMTRGVVTAVGRNIKDTGLRRDDRLATLTFMAQNAAAARAARLRNKYNLSLDLCDSAPHVFYCEVEATHPDQQSPLLGNAAAGGATLCYAYYWQGASHNFPRCPITNNWYQGNPVNARRVPKGVVIGGIQGPIRFCFWHAPSGNDGAIVAQVYQGLVLGCAGLPFVLFGDLNVEPNQLVAQGIPPGSIIDPIVPTRISGRCLDYAVTNAPRAFTSCRPLYTGVENFAIKQRTGSDHMVMVLTLS